MSYPTHAKIDGEAHLITRIDEHADGPHHTHRVHLGCGMTVDVDIGGERMSARAAQRSLEHADPQWRERHAEHSQRALSEGDEWHHARWTDHKGKSTCSHCAAVEAETAKPITHENSHNSPRTVGADIPTGLPCPTCGSQLYIRRANGTVGCSAQGHNFKVDEVLATSMGLLHKLATGAAEFKKE